MEAWSSQQYSAHMYGSVDLKHAVLCHVMHGMITACQRVVALQRCEIETGRENVGVRVWCIMVDHMQ